MKETLAEVEEEIRNEFTFFEDWQDRYAHIIELGNQLNPLPDEARKESNLVPGCQSRVWLVSSFDKGKIIFEAESDALIVQGLIAILLRLYSQRTSEEILGASTDFFTEIGLDRHLSPSRANGLYSLIKTIRQHALKYKN